MKIFRVMVFTWCLTVITAGTVLAAAVVGQSAPEFTGIDTNGNKHSLSDYEGTYVVLEWINHDCPFIRKHYNSGNMQKLQKEYTTKGVVWFSISSSAIGKQGQYGPEEADRLTEEKGASPTDVILDPKGEIGRLYGAQTTPHMFVINPGGELIYQGAIDDTPGVDVEEIQGAHNYVKAALDTSMNGGVVSVPMTKSYGCSVKY